MKANSKFERFGILPNVRRNGRLELQLRCMVRIFRAVFSELKSSPDGRSLVPALCGSEKSLRDHFLVENFIVKAFDALPERARAAVYDRLLVVLSGQATDKVYLRLSPADRQAILEILRDTKEGLPASFLTAAR